MRFSNLLPAAAGFAGLASATLGKIPCVSDLVKGTDKVVKPVFDLAHHWEDDILFQGELCAATETSAAIDLDLRLIQAAVDGQVGIDVSAKFLQAPALRLSLAGVKAFVQLDLSASAAVYESVELFITPELSVDLLSILDLDLKALIALDLLVGVSAAVDVSAGVYVSFAEDAYIDIDLLKKDVLDVNLANPSIEALPIAIGADVDLSVAVELELGLRLRTFIALEADVEIIGIDLLEAGAEVAIYVNLFDYKTTLIDGSGSCAVSCSKDIALTLGLAVKLDVSILDLIDVSLTPNVFLTLATVGDAEICLPDRGTFPDGSNIGGGDKETGSPSGLPSAGLPSGLPSNPVPTPDGSEIVDGGDNESGLPSGVPSAGLPSAGLPSVTLPTGLTSGLPSGPVPTPDGSEIVDDGNTGSDSDETDGGSHSGSDGSDSGSDSGSDASGSVSATITAAPSVHTPVHGGNGTMITSTEQVTATYTITKCEMDVVNCPANKKTVIVHSTVYYCPATKTKVPHLPEITKTSTMTPCPTPTKVTITDTPAKPTATPETPEHEKPKKPEGEKPKQPEQPGKPEEEQPKKPEEEKPEVPEQEKPEQPEEEKPEQPEQEKPEQPTPQQPEQPVCPGSPECPEETMVHAPPPSAAIPTPPASTPTEPATAGAGSIKVGMASVFLGAAIAVML